VLSTVAGVSEPARIDEIVTLMSVPVPGPLWDELDALAVAPALWLD
jgi:hypothetical protein